MCTLGSEVPVAVKSYRPEWGVEGHPGCVGVDSCMAEFVKLIDSDPDCAAIWSCCGHEGKSPETPYFGCVVPPEKIAWVMSRLIQAMDWGVIKIMRREPTVLATNLSEEFLRGKLLVFFYNETSTFGGLCRKIWVMNAKPPEFDWGSFSIALTAREFIERMSVFTKDKLP
jgi:hypothetical protein